jgi:hypothetical protein
MPYLDFAEGAGSGTEYLYIGIARRDQLPPDVQEEVGTFRWFSGDHTAGCTNSAWCDCCEQYVREVWYLGGTASRWCDTCASEYGFFCTVCDDRYHDNHGQWIDSADGMVCHSCIENHYSDCPRCEELFLRQNMVDREGELFCESCLEAIDEEEEDNS